jgi:flagellar FliJ protein
VNWAQSLIRIADFEIEQLQKRLREIADRRAAIEQRLAALDAEAAAEIAHAQAHAESGWYLIGFREGVKLRREKVEAELKACQLEESGARDALTEAFEAQKKYEQVAENARLLRAAETSRRESAVLDELALRRTGTW